MDGHDEAGVLEQAAAEALERIGERLAQVEPGVAADLKRLGAYLKMKSATKAAAAPPAASSETCEIEIEIAGPALPAESEPAASASHPAASPAPVDGASTGSAPAAPANRAAQIAALLAR